ncbi:MAG: succinylglutamate desuccinylase/aspartoacylase family protein [Hydrogenophaga sp.]|uniref:succinylglutamate desuccinylase/aspartoacylase family protein n=1 Tax=Hydrogenophaga sp. TaxID=1904254 RepID=UPI00274D9803|nr:succinylglutamate desuccinylase/aspartoacylase family protein [Hydrogenophaga sp.]MDP2416236.1 M14 family metallopeptidase [Hydrogenophaga sp.]MDZ4187861.1 succinylglutamate desuccinylase/aspartoacylase family protein [Hydrogenophaga sp.]
MSFQFGHVNARPKVYLQASLHAEELPGMLVAHHLRAHLEAAERDGRLMGQVVLVPAANPIGLAQRLEHKAMGRFDLDTAQNFNRHYPDLAQAVWEDVKLRLGTDAQANVTTVRACVGAWLNAWQPMTELESLRRRLLLLSHDADVVIDLHCDWEACLHLYSEESCWQPLEPLARLLGCQAVLLAKESGGGPFDERLSGLWWQLANRLHAAGISAPLPQGCASTTVELRGESDVSHQHATKDASALLAYLEHLGVVQAASPQELPALPCVPTPLAGSQTLRSPVPGVLVFLVQLGQKLAIGDVVAEVIDPTAADQSRIYAVCAEVAGVLYATVRERYIVAGGEVGKIAGSTPFRSGDLLGA